LGLFLHLLIIKYFRYFFIPSVQIILIERIDLQSQAKNKWTTSKNKKQYTKNKT